MWFTVIYMVGAQILVWKIRFSDSQYAYNYTDSLKHILEKGENLSII